MATPTESKDVGRIEHEIAQVRDDLGRTVAEIGARLTPAHLMEQAKQSLKEATTDTTRAVAQSATSVASGIATRTRDVAVGTRDQVQSHPIAAGLIGAGAGIVFWVALSRMRERRRLVPREWDEPFDRSTRRTDEGAWMRSPRTPWMSTGRVLPLAAAATAAWLIWRSRTDVDGHYADVVEYPVSAGLDRDAFDLVE